MTGTSFNESANRKEQIKKGRTTKTGTERERERKRNRERNVLSCIFDPLKPLKINR